MFLRRTYDIGNVDHCLFSFVGRGRLRNRVTFRALHLRFFKAMVDWLMRSAEFIPLPLPKVSAEAD